MSAATVAVNPPLPFTRDAIINQLRHQATNGPAYIQHGATKALAHLKGLYAEARYEAKLAFEAIRDAAREVIDQDSGEDGSLYAKIEAIRSGEHIVTAEDLGEYAPTTNNSDDDEEGSNHDDDEPH